MPNPILDEERLERAAVELYAVEYDRDAYPLNKEDSGIQKLIRAQARAAISAYLGETHGWQPIETALENHPPFMEPVLLTIRGRKLPIAVFRHSAESPWRYLESGKEIEDNIVPTHWQLLPAPPTLSSPDKIGEEN